MIAAAVFGCKKESVTHTALPQANPDKALVERVGSMTGTYIAGLHREAGTKTFTLPKWLNVMLKDAAGAVVGAAAGAEVGGLLGPGGAGAGAVIGGVIVGAAESFAAAQKSSIELPESGTITGNPDNPYDNAGQIHYSMLGQLLQDPSLIMNGESINYTAYRDYAFAALGSDYPDANLFMPYFTPESIQQSVEGGNPDATIQEVINGIPNDQMTNTEKQILLSYFSALQNSSSAAQFAAYSINLENAINTSTLTPEQKARLLTVMSTVRCGASFYSLN